MLWANEFVTHCLYLSLLVWLRVFFIELTVDEADISVFFAMMWCVNAFEGHEGIRELVG